MPNRKLQPKWGRHLGPKTEAIVDTEAGVMDKAIAENTALSDTEYALLGKKPVRDAGGNITGFEEVAATDPTSTGGKFGEALNLESEALERALRGEEPLDPTLRRELDEQEMELHERLRRQWGPDYASGSAGIEALADFDRNKAEAFANYNRETIKTYDEMSTRRAESLMKQRTEYGEQLRAPGRETREVALATGEVAGDTAAALEEKRAARALRQDNRARRRQLELDREVAEAQIEAAKAQTATQRAAVAKEQDFGGGTKRRTGAYNAAFGFRTV